MTPHGHPPPPPRKGPPVVLIVLLVIGGVLAVGGLVIGIKVYRFSKEALGSPVGLETSRSFDAPGARELRTLGCNASLSIIDVATMPELTGLYRSFPGRPDQPVDVPLVIQCTPAYREMTCNEVAASYVSVVKKAKTPFRVSVETMKHQVVCNTKYSPAGEPL